MDRRLRAAVTAAIAAAALGPATASASTLEATCDTLQSVLNGNVGNGDVIHLSAAAGRCSGKYFLQEQDAPTDAFTLEGADGAGFEPTADQSGRSLEGADSNLTVRNIDFVGNASGAGGFTYGGSRGSLLLEDTTFSGISREESGGALDLFTPSATLRRVAFTGNASGVSGGGARITSGSAVIEDSVFTDNAAGENGGGLALTTRAQADDQDDRRAAGDPDVRILRTTFKGNVAGARPALAGRADVPAAQTDGEGAGGGLWVGKRGDQIDSFEGGVVTRAPAGDQTASGRPVVVDLAGNVYDGNAVAAGDGDRSGGGAEFFGATVTAAAERYVRNSVGTGGGGEAESEGGGLSVLGAPVRSSTYDGTNDVVAGNRVGANGAGAGIYIGNTCAQGCGTRLSLVHATIAGNVTGVNGENPAIEADPSDRIELDRSIVWGSSVAGSDATPEAGEIGGTNDITVVMSDVCATQTPERATPDGAGNICENPQLVGPAADQGADVHLKSSSPVIDLVPSVAANVAVDFDGDPRPISVVRPATPYDMGADELSSADYSVTLGAAPNPVLVGDTLTYSAVVKNAGPASVGGLKASITLPAGVTPVTSRAAGQCTGAAPVVCDAGTVASGASITLKVPVRVDTAGSKTATVTVTGPDVDPTRGDHTATVTTTANARPAPTPPATTGPPATGGVLPSTGSGLPPCGSKRFFRITLRKIKGVKFVSARITVNGKRVTVEKRGTRLSTRIDLRRIGRKTIKVRIRAVTSKGEVRRGTRTYHPCRKGSGKKTRPKL
jgi:uncharacterized repeat protein (TIGR01451 family)